MQHRPPLERRGFTLMEIHKRREDPSLKQSNLLVVLNVAKDVLFNPIVFMVLIGIAGNFLFHQKMPAIIDDVLEVLGKYQHSYNQSTESTEVVMYFLSDHLLESSFQLD